MQDNSVTLSRKKVIIIAVAVGLVLALLIGSVAMLLTQTELPFSLPFGRNAQTTEFNPFVGVNFDNYIDVGEWRGVEIDTEPNEQMMEELLEMTPPVLTDRTVVADDDIVQFNMQAYVDGYGVVQELSGNEFMLQLGVDEFIPGFGEQLVNGVVGESFEITVVFPEEWDEELGGRDIIFTGEVTGIFDEAVEVSDEGVQIATHGRFLTLQELLEYGLAMQAFGIAMSEAEIHRLPDIANIYGPDGEEWAREDLFAFAIAAQQGITITLEDVEEALSDDMAMGMTAEDALQMHQTTMEQFVRGLMFDRIAHEILRYAVDADGNPVIDEAP